MQTTLLGLAIAIILALLAALVGPLLIDWSGQRSLFEVQATRLLGVEVKVKGEIDARLLPSPRLTLHDIEIGRAGPDGLRARSLGVEFALGPLMRGDWRASELTLAGPQVRIGLDASGHVQAPALAVGFDADALSVDKLAIEDGTVTLADASNGTTIALERLWFNGDARSLLGPFKGEGAVTVGKELYPFRLASGRYSDDAGMRIRLNIDPVNRPLSIETEGALTLAGGDPKFDGTLSFARPVGVALRGTSVTQPWRVTGKVKASAAAALIQQIEFQYGADEQGLKLTGVADFKFGARPRFDGVLSGRQIDLDRALISKQGARPLPAAAISQLAELGGNVFRPSIPIQIGVGIDQVTLGGNTVQNVRGDITSDAQGWNLERFEFRAPGYTQVRLSGRLAVGADRVSFTGPAEVDSTDPKALAAWLEGAGDSAQADLRPLKLRGDVTLASDRIAVARLRAEFDRRTITGRLAYDFAAGPRTAKLDAELNAPELDIDAALGFGNALLAGSKIQRPHDMTIAADIGRATIAGFVARDASARLKVDAGGLQIDRLSVADLGGAAFSASGRIVTAAPSPQGDMRIDLDAPDMTPVMALLAKFAPDAAAVLTRRAPLMAPAKLRARLTINGANAATVAKLGIDGSLGKVRVALNGQGNVDAVAFNAGDVKLDGKFDADDGKALIALLGLGRTIAVEPGAGSLTIKTSGPARGNMQIESRLTANGLDATIAGAAKLFGDSRSAALRATIVRADIAPLRGQGAAPPPLAFTYASRVALTANDLSLPDINATIGGASLRGKLSATLQRPSRVQGDLEADTIDGVALVAAVIGMPAAGAVGKLAPGAALAWPSEPFGEAALGEYLGQIALKARRLDALPRLTAREFRSTLRFGNNELAFDEMNGEVAGGRLTGKLSLRTGQAGLKANMTFALAGVDAAALMPAGARPAVSGKLDLSADMEGSGLSPVALIGSLHGAGKISLADGQFAGLDPRAFDAVTHAVDQGLPIDAMRIGDVVRKALDSGQLLVKRADGKLTISAGQTRLSDVTIDSKDAELSLSGSADLTDGSIGARLVLSGAGKAAGARPDIFMALQGPAPAPSRTIDVSALAGWLTLRAVENQTRQLRVIESQAPKAPVMPAPQSEQAPALPAPIDIRPLPFPAR